MPGPRECSIHRQYPDLPALLNAVLASIVQVDGLQLQSKLNKASQPIEVVLLVPHELINLPAKVLEFARVSLRQDLPFNTPSQKATSLVTHDDIALQVDLKASICSAKRRVTLEGLLTVPLAVWSMSGGLTGLASHILKVWRTKSWELELEENGTRASIKMVKDHDQDLLHEASSCNPCCGR